MKKLFLATLMLMSLTIRASTRTDTVEYTAKDGNHFRMIVVGDKIPELYKNGRKIDRSDFGEYEEIIGAMQNMLIERWKKKRNK